MAYCMEVTAIEGNKVICKVLNNGDLGENKGVNLPGVSIALPALAEEDKQDLIFGCEQGVDFVAASIRKRSDVVEIREHLKAHGGENIQIISEIENQEGLSSPTKSSKRLTASWLRVATWAWRSRLKKLSSPRK